MQNQRSDFAARQTRMSSASAGHPLSGKTILVTRQHEQTSKLVELLSGLGAQVILFPTIETTPPASWDACDAAVANINGYDGILFTSANAVRYFMGRAKEIHRNIAVTLSGKKIFAVGRKTQEAVEGYGINAVTFEGAQDSQTFGRQLVQLGVNGKRFLLPRGNLARSEFLSSLREQGAVVDEIIVYRTQAPASLDGKPVEKLLKQNGVDLVLFFSPSSITNFLGVIPRELLESVRIAAIGHTTAEAAHSAHLRVDLVADEPTTESLVSSIVRFYE